MGGNLLSCSLAASKIYHHSGATATISNSFASPSSTPRGLTWDGNNLLSCDNTADRIYHHSGTTATISNSFASPGSFIGGLTWDGNNLLSCDWTANRIYHHSGATATISNNFASPLSTPLGLAWDGNNLLSCDSGISKVYHHSGATATISNSFASPSTTPTGLAWEGNNLLSCDWAANRIYHHSGATATISNNFASPANGPIGLAWEPLGTAPTMPHSLLCEGAASPGAVTDSTPEFSAIGNDADAGDTLTHAHIQVNTQSNFTGTVKWDSGWLDIVDFAAGTRCPNISYAGTPLALEGQTYHWRIRFRDAGGLDGAYSAIASFRMQLAATLSLPETAGVVDITDAEVGKKRTESLPVVDSWSRAGNFIRQHAVLLALLDTASRNWGKRGAEALSLEDTRSQQGIFSRVLSDLLDLSDGDIQAFSRDFLELLSVESLISRKSAAGRTLAESLSLADIFSRLTITSRSLSEFVGLGDSYHQNLDRILSELIPVEELATRDAFAVKTEDIGLQSVAFRALAGFFAQALTLQEQAQVAFLRVATEAFGLTDSREQRIAKWRSETVPVVDSSLLGLAAIRHIAEWLEVADFQRLERVIVALESIEASDSVVFSASLVRVFAAALGISDEALSNTQKRVIEAVETGDNVFLALAGQLAEVLHLADSSRRDIVFRKIESLPFADKVALMAVLGRAYTEALAIEASVGKDNLQRFSEVLGLAGAVAHSLARVYAESVVPVDVFAKVVDIVRVFAQALSLSDGDVVDVVLGLTEAVVLAAHFSETSLLVRALTEVLALADKAPLHSARYRQEAIVLADYISKGISLTVDDAISLYSEIARAHVYARQLQEAFLLDDVAQSNIIRTVAEELSLIGQIYLVQHFERHTVFQEALPVLDLKRVEILKVTSETMPLAVAVSRAYTRLYKEDTALFLSHVRQLKFVRIVADSLDLSDGDIASIYRKYTESVFLDDAPVEKLVVFVLAEIIQLSAEFAGTVGLSKSETVILADIILRSLANRPYKEQISLFALRGWGNALRLTDIIAITERTRLGSFAIRGKPGIVALIWVGEIWQ